MVHEEADQHQREVEWIRREGQQAVAELWDRYRARLHRMVEFRLDRRVYGRVDAGDVLQESYLEVARRSSEFVNDPNVSFFVWARQIAWQTLIATHRHHLGAKKRDAAIEVGANPAAANNGTSVSLAAWLVGNLTSPSQGLMREERASQLRAALEAMDPTDREVLALRHFEHLSNQEVAEVLGLQKTAASNRYVRALERLKVILDQVMGETHEE